MLVFQRKYHNIAHIHAVLIWYEADEFNMIVVFSPLY